MRAFFASILPMLLRDKGQWGSGPGRQSGSPAVDEFTQELYTALSQPTIRITEPIQIVNNIPGGGPVFNVRGGDHFLSQTNDSGQKLSLGVGLKSEGITANQHIPLPEYRVAPHIVNNYYSTVNDRGTADVKAEIGTGLGVINSGSGVPNPATVPRQYQPPEESSGESSGGVQIYVGKPNATINKGSSGTVNIYDGTLGSESATGGTLTGVYNRFRTIESSKFVLVIEYGDGRRELMQAEC